MNRKQRRTEAKLSRTAAREATPAVEQWVAEALRHHQAGRLNEAEALYRRILTINPRHADGLRLLGVVAHQTARHDLAIELLGQAISVDATIAGYHSDLGTALGVQGRLEEAAACYRTALGLQPEFPGAQFNLGNTLRKTGKLDEAVACYRRAILLRPDFPGAHNNLGAALSDLGYLDEAVACHRKALDLTPDFPDAWLNLGTALQELGSRTEAAMCFRRTIDLRPDYAEAHYNLGNLLRDEGRLDEAFACLCQALEFKPDYAEAHNNLGDVLRDQGHPEQAATCFQKALELNPGFPEAHNNLGAALQQQGRLAEAEQCYRAALCLRPDLPDAHFNLALALLAQGDMTTGWEEHEWRWRTPQMMKAYRDFSPPQWRGEAVTGRTLLIHAEQGFGDTLQFCRYVPMAAERGARVILEVPKPLVRLLRGLPGADHVVARGDELPAFDTHCPMLSLPLVFETTVATIPDPGSYLCADEAAAAALNRRFAAMSVEGPRVGLVWAGNPRFHSPALTATDRRRSLSPDKLRPLFQLAGLHFISLQKDGPAAPADLPMTNLMHEMADFADTAVLIANLDLVISVDTAVVHLAAAMGKPVWILDRFDSCWRWLTGRRDSPWYPTVRLYRQPHADDWETVVAEIARDLRSWHAPIPTSPKMS